MNGAARRPVVIVTQARVGSSRLPAKVLLPMCGKPMLWWHLSRLLRAKSADRVMVATTDEPDADRIVAIAASLGVSSHRGSLSDVLARFQGAAEASGAASIVRVTSDCPLIDPALIDRLVEDFIADPALDYASLDVSRFPRGLDCEIVSRSTFDAMAATATEPAHREHVTSFLRDHPERFRLRFLTPDDMRAGCPFTPPLSPDGGEGEETSPRPHRGRGLGEGANARQGLDHSAEIEPPDRWCVDTPDDFALVERLLSAMLARDVPDPLDFGWRDLAAVKG